MVYVCRGLVVYEGIIQAVHTWQARTSFVVVVIASMQSVVTKGAEALGRSGKQPPAKTIRYYCTRDDEGAS